MLSIALWIVLQTDWAVAQTTVKCGDILQGEFTVGGEAQLFTISMQSGERLNVSARPFGDTLKISLAIFTPTGKYIETPETTGRASYYVQSLPSAQTPVLSARGIYTIIVANSTIYNSMRVSNDRDADTGPFTLMVGCTNVNGVEVLPGDTAQPPAPTPVSGEGAQPVTAPTNGFPGLAPVDFSKATKLKLPRSGEVEGEITPSGGEVLGFTFDAMEQQAFDLSFTRVSGNLNLGLVILSSDNKVYFQTSLVASSALNTQFALPSGKYTLGIFKIDLVTPANPEITEFAITLK